MYHMPCATASTKINVDLKLGKCLANKNFRQKKRILSAKQTIQIKWLMVTGGKRPLSVSGVIIALSNVPQIMGEKLLNLY